MIIRPRLLLLDLKEDHDQYLYNIEENINLKAIVFADSLWV